MGIEQGGWPTAYELLPAPIERVIEVAQRFGRFMLKTPEVHPYMSEHFRPEYPAEPMDGEALQAQLPFTGA